MLFTDLKPAPSLATSKWFNYAGPLSLRDLRGKVIVLYGFQMLCPGCVSHCIPQARELHKHFAGNDVAVLGIHTVFEHHDAMGPTALKAFIEEYQLQFPIAVDAPSVSGHIPQTMEKYGMRGTPSVLLIDKSGNLRLHHYGHLPDLQLAKLINQLTNESQNTNVLQNDTKCDEQGCKI